MTGMSAPENDAQAQFASLMGQLDQPMYVVTVRGADGPAGCLVGFASQVSIDPPLFLAGLSEKNHTWRASRQASHLAVHIIPRAEDELVHLFGELTGDSIDKFAQCAWRDGPHGVPILERSAAWFVGEILARVTLGDHIGHVLLPVAVSRSRELGRYVSFSDVRGLTPGHEA